MRMVELLRRAHLTEEAPCRFVVFERSLGIRRNAIVLPKGYEVVTCNTPVQVRTEDDGRVVVSFMATGPGATTFRVEARRVAQ